jgi:hypothetical protein
VILFQLKFSSAGGDSAREIEKPTHCAV